MINKVGIYCRLSVEDKNKKDLESESIKNQRNILIDFCQKNNFEIFNIYIDEDYSGLEFERPEFLNLLKDARDGKFNIILCKSQSRFTRDLEVAEKYINRLFLLWGIRFISITDSIDTLDCSNKKSRQINSLVNEWYCEDLSNSVKSAFKMKMKKGDFIGSFAPFGYKKSLKEKNKLEIDKTSAKTVSLIYELYLNGNSLQKVANILTNSKILTPTAYKLKKGEKFFNPNFKIETYNTWSKNTIKNILTNEVYIGNMVQGKSNKLSFKDKKVTLVPKNKWIIKEKTHTPIIEDEVFFKVKEKMNKKENVKINSKYKNFFNNKLFCELCGEKIKRGSGSKSGFYYKCVKSKEKNCNLKGILNRTLEEMVLKELNSILKDSFENLKENIPSKNLNILYNKLDKVEKAILALYKDKLLSKIDEDLFNILLNSLNEDKFQIISEIRNENFVQIDSEKKFTFKNLNEEIINVFIEKIYIGEDAITKEKTITICWKF